MMELASGDLSPSYFCELFGGGLSEVGRAFRQLAEWGLAEVVEVRIGGRRGGPEKVYRRVGRAYFDTASWAALPLFVRSDLTANILMSYLGRVHDAMLAETLDAEIDRHLSWDGLDLDRVAWTQVNRRLDELLAWLPELEAESARRMASSGEEPIPTTVGLAAFRSPKASERPSRLAAAASHSSEGPDASGRTGISN